MRVSRVAITLASLSLPFATTLRSQEPSFKFQPGEWQMNTVLTMPGGRTSRASLSVCANNSTDLSQRPHPGEQCDPPVVTPVPNGVRVQLACHGGSGTVTFQSVSDVVDTFAADGMSFTAKGSATTTTSVAGQAPIKSSVTMESQGKNIGACSKSK